MNEIKKTRWTEEDLDSLPAGEHDYFERKSGKLYEDMGLFLGKLAKTVSALSNTGGGHVILGVDDNGVPDGMPKKHGSASIKDWLEQKIPHLVSYPLQDFRVHMVERNTNSRILNNCEVVVIDVGDSSLAPHQCMHDGGDAKKYVYYFRQSGRSLPAPHFYLELLRQRLVSPALKGEIGKITPTKSELNGLQIRVLFDVEFKIKNESRVTAYKWELRVKEIGGIPDGRAKSFIIGDDFIPTNFKPSRGYRPDVTILPGGQDKSNESVLIILNLLDGTDAAIYEELGHLLKSLTLAYEIATEMSPGELKTVEMGNYFDVQAIRKFIYSQVGI